MQFDDGELVQRKMLLKAPVDSKGNRRRGKPGSSSCVPIHPSAGETSPHKPAHRLRGSVQVRDAEHLELGWESQGVTAGYASCTPLDSEVSLPPG